MKKHHTPLRTAVEVLNQNVGRTLWFSEFKFLYIRAGGLDKTAADTLTKLVQHYPGQLEWVSRVGHGRFIYSDVRVLKAIELC